MYYSLLKQPKWLASASIQSLISSSIRSWSLCAVEEHPSNRRPFRSFQSAQVIYMNRVSNPRLFSCTCSMRRWAHQWCCSIGSMKEQEHCIPDKVPHQISLAKLQFTSKWSAVSNSWSQNQQLSWATRLCRRLRSGVHSRFFKAS